MNLPPLSLYIHVPWCVRKCPYCDFNSHALKGELNGEGYVDALLADLDLELEAAAGRPLQSIFIGGGTPSLLAPASVGRLLDGIAARLALTPDCEITLEANPGTVEAARFVGYRAAGVNRLSIGVQSLEAAQLQALGRIHGSAEARAAACAARAAGFDNFNLDLMFGLPGQTEAQGLADLEAALDLGPSHLSWYQLTLEPNTAFHHQPPPLPPDDLLADLQAAGQGLLAAAGFTRYEVSAYAPLGRECRHNLNYWQFGDYLGIGAGAHAKVTTPDGRILRRWRRRHPADYLAHAGRPTGVAGERELVDAELGVEFLINALRLRAGVPEDLFRARTGRPLHLIAAGLAEARSRGLLAADALRATDLGWRFLDDLAAVFEPA
jgi:oxygen-independent coproporphyrinogen-3 oxidase